MWDLLLKPLLLKGTDAPDNETPGSPTAVFESCSLSLAGTINTWDVSSTSVDHGASQWDIRSGAWALGNSRSRVSGAEISDLSDEQASWPGGLL